MESLLQDVRYSLRQFWRAPLFAGAVISTVALAVGANTLLFAIANAAIFRPLPYPDSSRIVSITIAQKGTDIGRMDEPTARLAIASAVPAFEALAMYSSAGATHVGADFAERLPGARVSSSFFDVFGVKPAVGRTFSASETQAGGPSTVVLSDAVWTRAFGRRADLVGSRIVLDDRNYDVIGVMPPGFGYPGRSEFWLPLIPRQATSGLYFIDVVGRLQHGASVEQARAALVALRQSHQKTLPAAAMRSEPRVMPLHQRLYGEFKRPLRLLLATVACVLLIGCANIANLLLARSASRRVELATRLAVGASRGRLVRQLLVESVLLASLGAIPGIALAVVGLDAFRTLGPPALARLATLAIDNGVLLFAFSLTLGTGLLFGLAPAFAAARANVQDSIKGRLSLAGDTRWRPRRALVVLEIAAAVVLTLGAALLVKSFIRFQAVDRGFHAENVLTASITLSTTRYPSAASRRAFFDGVAERLIALPQVESVAVSSLALSGMSMTMEWPPAAERSGESFEIAVLTDVGTGHFRTFAIPLLEGRECAGGSDASAVLINRSMARRAYAERSPLGERLNLATVSLGTRTVVGVAADVPDIRTKAAPLPTIFACAGPDTPAYATVAVRAQSDTPAASLAPAVRAAVRALDPAQPVGRLVTVEEMIRDGMASRWFDAGVVAALSLLALVLALGGLYAVTAYSVAQRTREIGVRMALGADRTSVLTLVLRQGGMLVVAGVVLGVAAAIPMVRFLTAMLFDVQPLDPGVFAAVAALVSTVAVLATFIPARRASRVDPMVALRAE